MRVLYEDNHLIAVFKPPGILTQADKSGDVNMMDEVKDYLKKKHGKKGNVFLGLMHRLDRPVRGVVLFAKTSKGASRLSSQIRNNGITKIYHAIIEGVPEHREGALENYLTKDTGKRVAGLSDKRNGKRAELFYRVIKSGKTSSLVEINLKTGKFHQIRAQFSLFGHPILGDIKYGARRTDYEARAAARRRAGGGSRKKAKGFLKTKRGGGGRGAGVRANLFKK